MKYKILDWIGMIPLCALPWLYSVVFHAPLTITQAVVAVVLLLIQIGAIISCIYLRNREASGEKEEG